jgi:tRNA (adenine57-N1/adenine58-N1)-methyltransferase
VSDDAGTPHRPGHPEPLSAGETVVLTDRKDRRYLVRLAAGEKFSYHGGTFAHDELIGAPEGTRVRTNTGSRLLALRPTATDWTLKAPRGAQVVYPKDQAMIAGLADIAPGCEVVEAGAGSGALTAALLRAVVPGGRVVSFERREDFAERARRNVAARLGHVGDAWELVVADAGDHLAERACDRLVLDLLEPWDLVEPAAAALRPGGILCAYTPTITQVTRLREALDAAGGWARAETTETLQRGWTVDGLAVRPDHRMVAHTAFLTMVRRVPGVEADTPG